MKAIGYLQAGPVEDRSGLVEFEAPIPEPAARDLLVSVKGVSVNPVDLKVRTAMEPDSPPRVLGFDAAGVVQAVGSDVQHYKPGDEVFYAGDLTRPGSNAQFQLVDERIVGRKPESLDYQSAAAIPLTAITAWEMMFDSFQLQEQTGGGESILVIGGAGGVGSILIQLLQRLTQLHVIATASRPESESWVRQMGADEVVSHRMPLNDALKAADRPPRFVAALTHSDVHWAAIADLIAPRGHIALIDDPGPVDISILKRKAVSVSWEFMFTRSMFQTADMHLQRSLLNRVSELLDAGDLTSTAHRDGGVLTQSTLQAAHEFQACGAAIGKTVLGGLV
ncbi:MAG: zinc-binding alcohol dehydrogenase family protein [Pseudomonadota bacterium]